MTSRVQAVIEEAVEFVIDLLSKILGIAPNLIDVTKPLSAFGFTAPDLVHLTASINRSWWHGVALAPTQVLRCSTVADLIRLVSEAANLHSDTLSGKGAKPKSASGKRRPAHRPGRKPKANKEIAAPVSRVQWSPHGAGGGPDDLSRSGRGKRELTARKCGE